MNWAKAGLLLGAVLCAINAAYAAAQTLCRSFVVCRPPWRIQAYPRQRIRALARHPLQLGGYVDGLDYRVGP